VSALTLRGAFLALSMSSLGAFTTGSRLKPPVLLGLGTFLDALGVASEEVVEKWEMKVCRFGSWLLTIRELLNAEEREKDVARNMKTRLLQTDSRGSMVMFFCFRTFRVVRLQFSIYPVLMMAHGSSWCDSF
jgi:hypothetical protein